MFYKSKQTITHMDFKELQATVAYFDEYLTKKYPLSTQREKIYARTVKITEEMGELCNEVLAYNGDQRADKLDENNKEKLMDEFADVILTTLILARSMNVSIEEALEKKIEKIKARFNE